jgi:hypothetical protein
MNCQDMQFSGARGLEQEMTWRVEREERKGTLLQFFTKHGAVFDEEQKQVVAEARTRRAADGQRT